MLTQDKQPLTHSRPNNNNPTLRIDPACNHCDKVGTFTRGRKVLDFGRKSLFLGTQKAGKLFKLFGYISSMQAIKSLTEFCFCCCVVVGDKLIKRHHPEPGRAPIIMVWTTQMSLKIVSKGFDVGALLHEVINNALDTRQCPMSLVSDLALQFEKLGIVKIVSSDDFEP